MKSVARNIQVILVILLVTNVIGIAQPKDVIVHDPVMIKQGDTYYIFHTGKGISVKSSKDLKTWQKQDPVFEKVPDWVYKSIPKFDGSVWAPDIILSDGIYYLYYSVSAFGRNTSAIGVATNTTLNPADRTFKCVDQGMVIQSVPGRDMWNAIDPNIAFDERGVPWMAFGSFWNGIKIVKLQPNMKAVITDSTQRWLTIAARERNWKVDERDAGDAANPELDYQSLYTPELLEMNKNMKNGSIEAPFIFKKDDYYYLFASWDRCCQGLKSTYKIVVGRSKHITGPYVDRPGNKMIHGGGSLIAQGDEDWAAVGHPAAYSIDGRDLIVFHAYDKQDGGKPKLRIREIEWDKEGWPAITLKD